MSKEELDEVQTLFDQVSEASTTMQELVEQATELNEQQQIRIDEMDDALEAMTGHIESIATSKGSAEGDADSIRTAKTSATSNSTRVAELASEADAISERITSLEEELVRVTESAQEIAETAEALLPGATSAGLAATFRIRKEEFKWPKRLWAAAFIFSMAALFGIGYLDPLTGQADPLGTGSTLMDFLSRLPFLIPSVWLAIYSGRRQSQALRLEEEYAHKETLSNSFEGYKNALSDIEEDTGDRELTTQLIKQTLAALSIHAGRIYVGKHEDISPWQNILNFVRKTDDSS